MGDADALVKEKLSDHCSKKGSHCEVSHTSDQEQ
jgi:hypothetical protein